MKKLTGITLALGGAAISSGLFVTLNDVTSGNSMIGIGCVLVTAGLANSIGSFLSKSSVIFK